MPKLKNAGLVVVMLLLVVLLALYSALLDWVEWIKALGSEVKLFVKTLVEPDQWETMSSNEDVQSQVRSPAQEKPNQKNKRS